MFFQSIYIKYFEIFKINLKRTYKNLLLKIKNLKINDVIYYSNNNIIYFFIKEINEIRFNIPGGKSFYNSKRLNLIINKISPVHYYSDIY